MPINQVGIHARRYGRPGREGVTLFAVFALQLKELKRQVVQSAEATKLDHVRRRAQATIDFYRTTLDKRIALRESLPHDRDAAGVADFIAKAIEKDDSDSAHDITDYLTYFGMFATGVNTGVFDIDIVERLAGTRILAIASNYKSWIDFRRAKYSQPKLYQELAILADEMRERRSHEQTALTLAHPVQEALRAVGIDYDAEQS